ncbi:MAG: BrxA/BrxB family bacilliredoxin, partial [Acidobacteriota bacterium]|nr:BrxA/BrxB family bacilliredoxin [Acidobacteriota bacterium]
MPYPEMMIHGMRQELVQLGIEETKTPEAVKAAVENTEGTLMVVVNSVCGCAAGGVRPGIAMALQNSDAAPDKTITVFAGADIDATDVARDYFTNYAPSS